MPEGAVYVGRPTKWDNPFRWSDYRPIVHDWEGEPVFRSVAVRRRHAVTDFRTAVAYGAGLPDYPSKDEIRRDPDGKGLACWCPLPEPGEIDWCHARVLLEIANGDDDARPHPGSSRTSRSPGARNHPAVTRQEPGMPPPSARHRRSPLASAGQPSSFVPPQRPIL